MRKQLVLCIALLVTINVFAQTVIDVTEASFRLEGMSGEKTLYYGFAAEDQIIVNFQEKNGNTLKEFEIIELPSNVKFQEYKCTKIENKIIKVPKTGIYQFRLLNSALTGRICNLKIQRIPVSELSRDFNSTVYWKTLRDTSFTSHNEKYIIKSDTLSTQIHSSTIQLSSQNAFNGNRGRQLIDFTLPDNTIAWSFYIGVGSESKLEYERAINEFSQAASSALRSFDPLTAVALFNIPLIRNIQGEDNVKYWFMDNQNAELFNLGHIFRYYKGNDVIIEASQQKEPLRGKVYLGLLNDNTIETISVEVRIVAVQVNREWGDRELKKMNITESEVPYLLNEI